MTIVGVHICASDRGLLWGDSQLFSRDNIPCGHVQKVFTNPKTCVAGALRGNTFLLKLLENYITDCSIADVLRYLSEEFRDEISRARREGLPAWRQTCTCVIAGWSPQSKRIVAYVLKDDTDHVPIPVSKFVSPDVSGFENYQPRYCADVVPIAKEQMRRHYPLAGGKLTVASIRPHVVLPMEICEFGEDESAAERRRIVARLTTPPPALARFA